MVKTDLAVCFDDGVHLFHNDGGEKFGDVTKTVGIKPRKKDVSAPPSWISDHDGDLDLYITAKAGGGFHNILWRNNGNSTFTDISGETALGIGGTGGGLVTSDFNNDRAIDFVVAGGARGASVLLNPREGAFKEIDGIDFAKAGLPPAVGAVSFDFRQGWLDGFGFHPRRSSGNQPVANKEGKGLERVVSAGAELEERRRYCHGGL